MIPVLTDANDPTPQTLAKGKLYSMISCVIHEELNGEYYMTFEYPVTAGMYSELMSGGTIRATAPKWSEWDDVNESFDICKHSTEIDGIVTFVAQHASRRLSNAVLKLLTISGTNVFQTFAYGNAIPVLSTDTTYQRADLNGLLPSVGAESAGVSGTVNLSAPKSVLSAMIGSEESLAHDLGGDFSFRTSNGNLVIYYDQRRGEDRGASIRFGVNMLDIEQEKDRTGTFNAYVPFWDDGNGNITYCSGYLVQPTTPLTPIAAAPLDCSNEFETQPTSAQLVSYARSLLDANAPWTGTETIKVDFVNGVEIDPHAAEIRLGDTVHVYWGDADIATDLRVVAYDYDVLAERYIYLELGTPQTEYVAVTGESYAGEGGTASPTFYVERVNANGGSAVSVPGFLSSNFSVAKSGYRPIGIAGFTAGNSYVYFANAHLDPTNQNWYYELRQPSGNTVSCYPSVWVLYLKM